MRGPDSRCVLVGGAAVLVAVVPSQAMAHPVVVTSSAFVGGALHSFTGLDHALAMIGVGVLSTRLLRRDILRLPLAFVVFLTTGAGLGYRGGELRFAEAMIASSCVVLGVCILSSRLQGYRRSIFAVAAGFAAAHGYVHATELPVEFGAGQFTVGFVAASAVMHILGVFIGEAFKKDAHRWLVQILGVAMVAFGALFLMRGFRV